MSDKQFDPFGNEIKFGVNVFVGKRRRDGKTPVRFVFLNSGVRLNKLLDDDALAALRTKPGYSVRSMPQ
jgi:hypothetical protein